MMMKRLRRKIIVLVLTICLLLLVVILTYVFIATRQAIMSDSIGSMEWVIQDLETGVYYGIPKGTPSPMAIVFLQEGHEPELSVSWNMSNVGKDEELPALALQILEFPEDHGFYTTPSDAYLAYRYTTLSDGRTVVIITDVSGNRRVLNTYQKNAFLAAAVSLVVMGLLSVIFARWVTKPIEQAQENQKNFFAAASHDLKTPLTIILSNVALLLDAPENDPLRDQYSGNIQSSAAQMKNLIQNMLDNISFETMTSTQTWPMEAVVPFSYLLEKSVFSFEALFYERNRTLRYDLEQDLYTRGNAHVLERLIGILLENALKYSNEHSEVYVCLKSLSNGAFQMDVHSISEPISKEELTKIFQPFYRVDKSRSDHGSYGLGLSIASNIVTAHKGMIWVTTQNNTNIFHVSLPKSAPPSSNSK